MKQIKGFNNYFVDKDGTITTKSGKKLKHFTDNYGYLCVTLRKDGKSYTKRVHRLVGETYLKPVKGKNIINHKDGNKKNCHIDNLEYMSNAENTKHGYDNNLYKSKSMLPIIVTDLEGNHIGDYRSIRAVSNQLSVNRKTLSSILNGDRKNNYNYNFKYKDNKEEDNMDKIAMYKEEIFKEAATKQEKDENRTKWIKDRVMPAMRSENHAFKGGAIGAGVGATGAMLGSQVTSALTKHIVKKKGIPAPDSAIYKAFTSPKFRKARLGISAAMGAARMAPKGAKTGRVIGDMKDLENKTRTELHREPTEKEYKAVARLDENNAFDRKLGRLINNPNAIVKSNLRQKKQ